VKKILKDRSFRLSIILTIIFLGTGIIFLFLELAYFSWILFAFLPVVLGISIGALPNRKWAFMGVILSTLCLLFGLLTLGLAGFLCVIYAIPLILPLIFLGSVITHLVKRYKRIRSDRLSVLLIPLIFFVIGAPIENSLKQDKRNFVEVKTERFFDYTPEQVYDVIKSVDTLNADKPLLMYFDLPVPIKCVLEKEEVGGIRTCYFKGGNLSVANYGGGTIKERITELKRGEILKMDVIECNLIGRKWLGFKEAIYYFEKEGVHGCKLTRVTTYTSVSEPRFYWEPLEKLGIEHEHEYVFNNLEKDLKKRYIK
jgi:hypothetical protein